MLSNQEYVELRDTGHKLINTAQGLTLARHLDFAAQEALDALCAQISAALVQLNPATRVCESELV